MVSAQRIIQENIENMRWDPSRDYTPEITVSTDQAEEINVILGEGITRQGGNS